MLAHVCLLLFNFLNKKHLDPTLAFSVDEVDKVHDKTPGGFCRQAKHPDCNFEYTSTFQMPLKTAGYNQFVLEVTDPDTNKKYTKIIPFVVTESLGK